MEDAKKAVKDAEKLIEDLENYQSPALQVDDISDQVVPFLSKSVTDILDRKVRNILGSIDNKPYEVRYIGVKGLTAEVKESCEKLAEVTNDLCKKYKPLGILGGPLKYDLYPIVPDKQESFYLLYLAFSSEDAAKIPQETPGS